MIFTSIFSLKILVDVQKKKKTAKIILPRPGFEPGLLRPQRSVLTTRRSRRATPHAVSEKRKKIIFGANPLEWFSVENHALADVLIFMSLSST